MLFSVFLFLSVFEVYLLTHCATFNINDSGETIMVCDLLTVSHSPGYPLHSLWGRVNCLLPLGQPMLRVTFASLLTGSFSVVVLYHVLKMLSKSLLVPAHETAPSPGTEEAKPLSWLWEVPALFGALVFAFSYQQWFQAGGAKGGVYTLNTLFFVLILFFLFKMRENGWFTKGFLLITFIYGLGLAHHLHDQIAFTPGYILLFLVAQRRVAVSEFFGSLLRPFDLWEHTTKILSAIGLVNIIRACSLGLIAISVYLYLPLRAIQHPLVNWWNPDNYVRLWGTIARLGYADIGEKSIPVRLVRNSKRFLYHAQDQYGAVFTVLVILLCLWGIWWLLKRQAVVSVAFFLMASAILAGVFVYCSPLEGYQWTLDNFFATVFLVMAVFAAMGVLSFLLWVWKRFPRRRVLLYTSAFCLGLALIPLLLNYHLDDQSRYVSSYDEGMNMLKTANRDAVILCNGDIDILPLWYLQYVEHKRPEVVSFTMQLIPYDWYRDPLFKRWPFLEVPLRKDIYGRDDIRPETVVQDMIDQHAKDRSFYFTNIFTAPWMREKNQSLPEGFLWRMVNTKDLNYPFTSARLNLLWDTYRIRNVDAPDRGYWDEYTDVMKDSYGIGYDFSGYFAYMNKMPDLALWCFNNALKYRQPQTLGRIYMMLGETYLSLGNYPEAVNNYQESLKRDSHNPGIPYILARMGDAFRLMNDFANADSAYHQSLSLNPQQKEALDGLQLLNSNNREMPKGAAATGHP